jgi:hypothetical protein
MSTSSATSRQDRLRWSRPPGSIGYAPNSIALVPRQRRRSPAPPAKPNGWAHIDGDPGKMRIRRQTVSASWIVTEIVPRFAFNLRHCPRTPAPSGQKKCPERTGLLLGTERHWSHFGERQRLSRDPAPPAPLLVRGFGGGGASRFNPARDPNHVSQETLI